MAKEGERKQSMRARVDGAKERANKKSRVGERRREGEENGEQSDGFPAVSPSVGGEVVGRSVGRTHCTYPLSLSLPQDRDIMRCKRNNRRLSCCQRNDTPFLPSLQVRPRLRGECRLSGLLP